MSEEFRDRYQYLVQATNRIYDLVGDADHQPVEVLAQAAAQAHAALEMLLEDPRFARALKKWAAREGNSPAEERELIDQLASLATAFMKMEKKGFIATGHSAQATEEILWAASMFMRNAEKRIDPKKIIGNIVLLQDTCLRVRDTLYKEMDGRKRRKIFQALALGFGGVSMATIDSMAGIMSPGVAAYSIRVGWAMIGTAASNAAKAMKKRRAE